MASNTTTTQDIDALRSALEAARAEAEAAQAKVDDLISEQADIPSGQQAALRDGDGIAYAILSQRERELPGALYFAQVQALKARAAVVEAERAVLEAELKPLMAEFATLDAAAAQAMQARGRVGGQIDAKRQRMRMIIGQRRNFADKQAALQGEFEKQLRIDSAPVVRSMPHAVRAQ